MDNQEILQHLLALEAEADDLVKDAQAEADRRVSEGEKQNRLRYDEVYAREVETLEISWTQNLAAVKENYRKQLDAYRESQMAGRADINAFSSLAEKFLAAEEAGKEA